MPPRAVRHYAPISSGGKRYVRQQLAIYGPGSMRLPHIQNPIRGFAVLCVAVIAGYIMWMGYRVNETLAGPGWCGKAIGAERADSDSKIDIAASCVGLLTLQLKSVSTTSLIYAGSLCLCLVALIVIVIAGGKLSISASKTGVNANIGREDVKAAEHVLDKAQEGVDDVKQNAVSDTSPDAGLPAALR